MSLHPGTGSYNPAGNSDFTRKAEALALGRAKQENKPGFAVKLMDRFAKIKADRQKGKS